MGEVGNAKAVVAVEGGGDGFECNVVAIILWIGEEVVAVLRGVVVVVVVVVGVLIVVIEGSIPCVC